MWRKDCGAIVSPIAEGKSAAVYPVLGGHSGHTRDILCMFL